MLKLSSVTKSFPETHIPILSQINLFLTKGEFCVVIGANGSGKSTLLKIISQEHLPDSGKLEIQGKIAQVSQDINQGTIASMTLLENVALSKIDENGANFFFYKRYQNEIITKIKDLGLGLEAYLNQPISHLSGGQKQLIAMLMALSSGSQILLLDEHTSALDPRMQTLLMDYTAQSIAKLNLTTVMVTHNMNDAVRYGNRLIMLEKGKIVLDLANPEKQKLKPSDLLDLFRHYAN